MRLGAHIFSHTADSGETAGFRAVVTVVQDGTFYATVPDEYTDALRCGDGAAMHRGKLRFSGGSLPELQERIDKALAEYLKFDTRDELVIRYDVETTCHYCISDDGDIFADGNLAKEATGSYKWADQLNDRGFSNFSRREDYSVALKAVICRKQIDTRGASFEKITYHPMSSRNDGGELGKFGILLNSFVKVKMSDKAREIPYTEGSAEFFYRAMMSLCGLADRLYQFFRDEVAAQKAIETGMGVKLLEVKE